MTEMRESATQAAVQHAAVLASSGPVEEFQKLEEDLRHAREEASRAREEASRAREEASRLSLELNSEKEGRAQVEDSAARFLKETQRVQGLLDGRGVELGIIQRQLSGSEASRVQAECDNETLLGELTNIQKEKRDLEDGWQIALEETRYNAAVRCRDATAKENAPRQTTFLFFDGIFPPPSKIDLGDEPPAASANELPQRAGHPRGESEADQSDNPVPHVYEEQVDYESE